MLVTPRFQIFVTLCIGAFMFISLSSLLMSIQSMQSQLTMTNADQKSLLAAIQSNLAEKISSIKIEAVTVTNSQDKAPVIIQNFYINESTLGKMMVKVHNTHGSFTRPLKVVGIDKTYFTIYIRLQKTGSKALTEILGWQNIGQPTACTEWCSTRPKVCGGCYRGTRPCTDVLTAQLKKCEKDKPLVSSSHVDYFDAINAYSHLGREGWGKLTLLTMVRNPTIRAVSEYKHLRGDKEAWDYTFIGRDVPYSVEGLQKWLNEPKNAPGARNRQTRMIAGHGSFTWQDFYDTQNDSVLLEAAKRNLNEFAWIGIQERFLESIELLNYIFNWEIAFIPYVTEGKERKIPLNIDPATKDLIKSLNSLDMQLYDYCLTLHEMRYAEYKELQAQGQTKMGMGKWECNTYSGCTWVKVATPADKADGAKRLPEEHDPDYEQLRIPDKPAVPTDKKDDKK